MPGRPIGGSRTMLCAQPGEHENKRRTKRTFMPSKPAWRSWQGNVKSLSMNKLDPCDYLHRIHMGWDAAVTS